MVIALVVRVVAAAVEAAVYLVLPELLTLEVQVGVAGQPTVAQAVLVL